MEDPFPKRTYKNVKLHSKGVDKERIRESRPRISPDKGHKEPKPYQHHDVDILVERVECG